MKEKIKSVLRALFGDFRGETFVVGMVVGFLLFMFVAFRPIEMRGTVSGDRINVGTDIEGVDNEKGYIYIKGWASHVVVGSYPFWRDNIRKRKTLPPVDNLDIDNLKGGD